jgi:phosphate transport system substrate-binding protein
MTNLLRLFFGFLAISATTVLGAQKRIYVEPFATQAGAEKLRQDVIGELRKTASISVVSSETDADAVLGGGGAIWVKGYESLNPRSGRSPSDGRPVYGGYLSVELRDAKGVTLWSDLVTPDGGAEDVARDLSKKIAKHVAEAMLRNPAPKPAVTPTGNQRTELQGAGATFPYPVYDKWFLNYRRENPSCEITYQPVGSEGGIRRLLTGTVDFAASDSPQSIHDLAPAEEGKYLFFPAVAGAVVPIVNLPGYTGQLSFTPEILAGIYLGKITKWSDPKVREANRGARLPDLDIVVVHRSEGSGTSYAWTDFLSKTNAEWKDKVGTGLSPQWPAGRGAAGNDGVAKLVKELGGSIGYVEFIYALRNQLSYGKVRNQQGEFVEASLESIALAARQGPQMGEDLKVSIVNAPGAGAYPIASFTWFVTPVHVTDEAKREAMAGFLRWMTGPGQLQAAALGYVALPRDVVALEQAAIARVGK